MSKSKEGAIPRPAKNQVIGLEGHSIGSAEVFGGVTLWRSYSFSPDWFRDAARQADEKSHDARRREIVFAVCFTESYLLEWVRDMVLNRKFKALDKYFPPKDKRSITDKWKEVPKQLHRDGLISNMPDLSGSKWAEFRSLVDLRNGLVHARSSRPETPGLAEEMLPLPSRSQLEDLEQGWALKTAYDLAIDLNLAAGTSVPDWLKID